MIKTAITHIKLRNSIRLTWQSKIKTNSTLNSIFQYYFVAAKSKNINLQTRLNNECLQYSDILVAQELDSYHNVTKKMVMGMKYVLDHCESARYVVHLDDDTYFSANRFLDHMSQYGVILEPSQSEIEAKNLTSASGQPDPPRPSENPKPIEKDYIDCGSPIVGHSPVIRPNTPGGKRHPEWTVSFSGYSSPRYPSYCTGACFGMPIEVYSKIYNYTRNFNLQEIEHIDDMMFTGLMRVYYKVKLYNAVDTFCWHLDNKRKDGRIDQRMVGFHNRLMNSTMTWLNRKKRETFEWFRSYI